MKMARLSSRSGVGAPTIRYYIREGPVSAGTLTSPNQASYDETHLRALRLVRALIDVGGLSIEDAAGSWCTCPTTARTCPPCSARSGAR